MTQRHPFEWLSPVAQKRAFPALLIFTLAVQVGMGVLDVPLGTEVSPLGIVSFEFAGNLSFAKTILEAWGPAGQVYAGLSLGLDYLFLVAYASCIALGCALVARGFSTWAPSLSTVGVFLSWTQGGAAVLDAVENFALIQLLLGSERAIWPAVAKWCAIPKFLIVAVGLVYMCGGAVAVVAAYRRADPGARTRSGDDA